MQTRSIRFRLTVWYALVLTAALVLFGGLLWLSLRNRLLHELDEELAGSATRFEAYVRNQVAEEGSGPELKTEIQEFCDALPPEVFLQVRSPAGFSFEHRATGRMSSHAVRTVQREIHAGPETFRLTIGTSEREIRHTLELVQLLLFGLIPVVIAIACAGGVWLSRRALRPVDEITAAASAIGIDNLSGRLPVPATGDEIERLAQVWNSMLARLESAVTTLTQFAADASHELRTPLAVIRTNAELALRRERSPESYRESMREIAGEAERMTILVEDLLFLARGDAGTDAVRSEPVELSSVLRNVTSEFRGPASEGGVEIRHSLPAGEVVVPGNRAALERLFRVLVDNAVKYSHPGGAVDVRLSNGEGGYLVEIEDSGIGIGRGDLPHIFQRFYRADKARSNGGHGLGLSLARTIAQTHGAIIEVRSVEGQGSVFSVRVGA